ncbi:MAG: PAS domain S-box protein, partial [Promethearchaeota archaeon]
MKELEERYRLITENSNDLIRIFDKDFNFEYINEANHLKQLGYSKEDLIGMNGKIIVHPDEYEQIDEMIKQTLKEGKARREGRIKHKNGEWKWYDIWASLIEIQKDNWKVLLISRDITERKNIEHKLMESEEKYRLITENVYDLIGILDKNFKYEFLNEETFLRVLGYSNADLIGKSALNFIHPDDVELAATALKKGFDTGEGTAEIRFRHKMGHWIWLEARGKTFIDQDGNLKAQIISRDITEKKAIADKIRKSEEILRKFIEESQDGLVLTDTEGNIIEWNKGQEEIFGIKRVDTINKPIWDIFYQITPKEKLNQEYKIQLKKMINHAIKTGEGPFLNNLGEQELEFTNRKKVIQQLIFPIESDGSYMLGAINRDVTKFKVAEQELKESEGKYRSLFENMTSGFAYHEVIVDHKNKPIDYRYIEVNPAFERLTNMKKEDLIGKTVTEAIPGTENDPADWIGKFGNVGLTGVPITVEDYSEAMDRWYKVSGYSPKRGYFAVTFSDITDRKKAEQKLKDSEEKFRVMAEQSYIGILIIQDYDIKYSNQKLGDIIGYDKEEIESWKINDLLEIVYEEDQNQFIEIVRKKYQNEINTIKDFQFRVLTKSGGIKWLEVDSRTIPFGNGLADLTSIMDITERKLAEQKLQESEKILNDFIQSATDSITIWDSNLNLIEINKIALERMGMYKEYIIGKHMLEIIPEIKETGRYDKYLEVLKTGNPITFEGVRTLPGFKEGYYNINAFKVGDGLGVMSADITEHKRAEFEISNLAKFPSENPSPILRVDGEKIIYANKAAENLFDLHSKSELPSVLKNYVENSYKEKAIKSFEILLKDRIYSLIVTPVKDVDYVNIYGMDITDRKVAEQKIIVSEKKYRDAFERANLYKDLFAHDINNLLQIINSSAELISYQLNGVKNASDIQNISEIIKKQVQRGSKLVKNVRTLSDLEDKDIELGLIDSCEVLRNSIDFINKAYSERQININIDCKEDNYLVDANELLHEVFDNLLINAIKHNSNQKIEININILRELKENRNYI